MAKKPKIQLIHGDSRHLDIAADLIMTDPPYDMPGADLASILGRIQSDHLVLVTSMRQLFEFTVADPGWRLSFDFVLDAVVPKKSMNARSPHYTHQTGVYMTRNGARSLFNRKLRQRSYTFDGKGFWPSVLRAPRDRQDEHGMAKNLTAWTDILGSFEIGSVVDPFAGSGTTAFSAIELGIDCVAVEIDEPTFLSAKKKLTFLGW
jgi:DNA modification methylase